MAKLEREFQPTLIEEIEAMFPGCVVFKNESYIQGFPDLTICYGKKWACLETKRAENAKRQPNQPFYVARLNYMSFARFVSPENKEKVLGELRTFFEK